MTVTGSIKIRNFSALRFASVFTPFTLSKIHFGSPAFVHLFTAFLSLLTSLPRRDILQNTHVYAPGSFLCHSADTVIQPTALRCYIKHKYSLMKLIFSDNEW